MEAYSEVIAFHAQKVAEKLIKNIFVQNDETPSKTHSIGALLRYAIERGWLSREAEGQVGAAALLLLSKNMWKGSGLGLAGVRASVLSATVMGLLL